MVDDFKQSQDPVMKQGWVERFEPNFAKYKELGVGYSKYFSLRNYLIQNYRYLFITFRKGWIAPFKGSFGDTQNGHVHV